MQSSDYIISDLLRKLFISPGNHSTGDTDLGAALVLSVSDDHRGLGPAGVMGAGAGHWPQGWPHTGALGHIVIVISIIIVSHHTLHCLNHWPHLAHLVTNVAHLHQHLLHTVGDLAVLTSLLEIWNIFQSLKPFPWLFGLKSLKFNIRIDGCLRSTKNPFFLKFRI